jgi:hypothetical protein
MHSELAGGAALIAFVFLQHGENESFLEFANSLRVEDVALVHLHDECFELVSHVVSLSKNVCQELLPGVSR